MYEIDEDQIKQWWSIFNKDNHLVEIRLLGKNPYSGYFNDVETLIEAIEPYADMDEEQV